MKVLISAYACEPHKGSEPGAGWNWSLAAAREHEVWVLTRANNREPIETELARRPQPNLHFVYLDLPTWLRWWKRGQRGVRLYYVLWQIAALRAARRLHAEVGFDLVHHLTFANVWLPAPTCFVDTRFVLGPVGGGPRVPLRLYPELGWRGSFAEVLLQLSRLLSRANPLVRSPWRKASVIIVQNDETLSALPSSAAGKALVHPNASVSENLEHPLVKPVRRRAIYAGRLVPWKGVVIALKAMTELPDWTLEIAGSGHDERRLRRLVAKLGLDGRVHFSGWLPRNELHAAIAASEVLVMPSLREDASLVLVEAISLGTPVIALDCGGPRAIQRLLPQAIALVPVGARNDLGTRFADAIRTADEMRFSSRDTLDEVSIARFLRRVYDRADSTREPTPRQVTR